MWKYNGQHRPEFAEKPGPGMESVWDFPRPPRLEAVNAQVEAWKFTTILHSTRGRRARAPD
jgi:hypothetical protein